MHDIGRVTHGHRHPERMHQLIHGGGLRALAKLRAEGQIDAIGIGVNEIPICLELLEEADLDVILLAGTLHLVGAEAARRFVS